MPLVERLTANIREHMSKWNLLRLIIWNWYNDYDYNILFFAIHHQPKPNKWYKLYTTIKSLIISKDNILREIDIKYVNDRFAMIKQFIPFAYMVMIAQKY
eukprot:709566_1